MSDSKQTRANVPPPRSKSFLPDPVSSNPVGASDNMSGERLAPMTFNMPKDWHARFKIAAAIRGISMKELLMESFIAWEREQKNKG